MGLVSGELTARPAGGRWPAALRGWPLWGLEPRLRALVITVTAAGLAAVGVAAACTAWRPGDVVTFGALLALGAITVEATRRLGEPAGASQDAHGFWQLPVAILLPPFYALCAPTVLLALIQWRGRRTVAHRRVFSAAACGLSWAAASGVFHAAWPGPVMLPRSQAGLLAWGLLAAACGAVRWAVGSALVLTAVRLDDPAARVGDQLGGRSWLGHDAVELCVGVLVTFCAATGPVLLAFALPCGILLQRSARQSQLLVAARTDAQTGLLSPAAWRREAAVRVTLAARAGTPQAVAIVRIDDFRVLQDACGDAAAGRVLREVAGALAGGTSGDDLPGRLGPAEFVLLAQADAAEAVCIAELLRARVSELVIPAGAGTRAALAQVTVSIGVAALGGTVRDLTDLLTAADVALYWAQCAGCNSVRLAGRPPSR